MGKKLICRILDDCDINPADENDIFQIDEHTFRVTAYIKSDAGDIPIVDIPVMSDERWLKLSKEMNKKRQTDRNSDSFRATP
ncbi:MAG: hypothetical protein GX107_03755 [Clostridiales bacterium]|jgi:hypothetical protein|nr:hypothetical protein [Clostridiales bacterium]